MRGGWRGTGPHVQYGFQDTGEILENLLRTMCVFLFVSLFAGTGLHFEVLD